MSKTKVEAPAAPPAPPAAPVPKSSDAFSLFVSCVEGFPVTRWGTRTFIGAERDRANPNQIIWYPSQVVAIPAGEHARHRKEYNRALKDGELKVRTAEEWEAQAADDKKLSVEHEKNKLAAAKATAPAKE